MNMRVRDGTEEDFPRLFEYATAMELEVPQPYGAPEWGKVREYGERLMSRDGAFLLVLEDDEGIFGMATGGVYAAAFSKGRFVSNEILYVAPARRSLKALRLLVDSMAAWSRGKAPFLFVGSSTGRDLGPFLKRKGFTFGGAKYWRPV